jgi:hypothetical protein
MGSKISRNVFLVASGALAFLGAMPALGATINIPASVDGFINDNNWNGYDPSDPCDTVTVGAAVGAGMYQRGALEFNLSSIPAGSTIQAVTFMRATAELRWPTPSPRIRLLVR